MQTYRYLDTERPKPRLKGTRLNVVQLWEMAQSVDGGVDAVASRWDVPVEAVEEAVQYYEVNRAELESVLETEREDASVAEELQRDGIV